MSRSKDDLLCPVLSKISRAEHHINDLSTTIDAYLLKKPLRLVTRGEPHADRSIHFIKEYIPLPDVIPLILGDAIHNLRSSLDIMIFSMVGDKAVKPEAVKFPFSKRAESLEQTITNSETNLAGKKVVDEIKNLKPYPGGHQLLGHLNVLDITDKHKLIIPTIAGAAMSAVEFAAMLPGINAVPNVDVGWSKDASFIHASTGTRAMRRANRGNIRAGEYERDIQPDFQIIFDDGQPFAGRPLIPVLVEMAKEVRAAAEVICAAFFSESGETTSG